MEVQWTLLFQKTLKPKDKSTTKLKSRNTNFTDFYNSIPTDSLRTALFSTAKFPKPVPVETKNGTALAKVEAHDGPVLRPPAAPYACSIWIHWSDVLPITHFNPDREIFVYYRWEEEELRLRIQQPETPYALDLMQEPTEWRELGRKGLVRCEIGLGKLLIPQSDVREFVGSAPTEDLRLWMAGNGRMDVEIYTAGGVAGGQVSTVESRDRDLRSTAVAVTWGQAARLVKARRLGEGVTLVVWYRWAFGMLELAIFELGESPPLP